MTINKIIVIFTEGETDEIFYKKLCNYFEVREVKNLKIIVKNLKGVSRYENKAPAKLQHEVINRYPKAKYSTIVSRINIDFEIILMNSKLIVNTSILKK